MSTVRVRPVKVQEAPNIYPKYFCSCGQLVGGYKVEAFMGDSDKMDYCPRCGAVLVYTKEAGNNEKNRT